MTTENVAILFTDIVGSTELSQRLSAETADEVRRNHFSILRQTIAEAGGSEVKNLGDGLMVVFGSASGALSCAVAMQQGVERDNRGREHSVSMRVGLSGGEASREDDDYFGDPVVEAARLCALCESGQVLATEWVRLTAGRRMRHDSRSLGPLTLKGLRDPVDAVEVIWEPLGGTDLTETIPLPSRLAVGPPVGVVGRDTEVAAITHAVKVVESGGGRQIFLVSGEAGLGKTALVAEAARSAFDNGACVLFGHCEEHLATPYQLFAEALGYYVTHVPEERLVAHVEDHGSELTRLVPALASRVLDLPPSKATDSDTDRYLLFAAVVGLLATATAHQPVVVVLDDLQWADKGSLLLLRHLAASDEVMRLLVIGTYRDTELSQAHPLLDALAALRRLEGVTRINLTGLNDSGVAAIFEAAAGQTLDDDGVGLAQAVCRETDGNPFFVGEVLRHLVETGALFQDSSGRWMSDLSLDEVTLPESVREVIGSRVGRLGSDAGNVLSTAAVIGRDFDLDVLARATQTSEDDLLDILEAAAAAALVREPAETSGRYSFAHALIQHTLSQDLGPNRRAQTHRKVAEALEDLYGDRSGARAGELVRHWLNATPPIDIAKAMAYARQAGDAALDALAPADALGYYTQALDLYSQTTDPDPILGLDLAIGLGTAQRQAADPAFRDTLIDAARRAADIDDTDHLVAASLANNRGWTSVVGIVDKDKVEVLEKALDHLPGDHPDRALVLATLCSEFMYSGTFERRQALADEALIIARASHDDATLLRVLNHIFGPLMAPSAHQQSMLRTAEALRLAQRVGDPVLLFFAALWRSIVAHIDGNIDETDRCLEIMEAKAAQLDQPVLTWLSTMFRAMREILAGNTGVAEELVTQSFQLSMEANQPDAEIFFGSQFVCLSVQRGTTEALLPLAQQLTTNAPNITGTIRAYLAMELAESDRIAEAAGLLEEFAAAAFELPFDGFWLTGMVHYASAAIAVGDRNYAEPLFDRLSRYADLACSAGPTADGPVSYFLGGLATVLERYDEADVYFARSAAMCDRMGARFFAARTDLSWGMMLAERRAPGDANKARDLLTRTHSAAVANGYGTVERRAGDALQGLD